VGKIFFLEVEASSFMRIAHQWLFFFYEKLPNVKFWFQNGEIWGFKSPNLKKKILKY
jgi:hypothetical protein